MKSTKAFGLVHILIILITPLTSLATSDNMILSIDGNDRGILPSSFCLAPNTPTAITRAAVARRLFNQLEHSLTIRTQDQYNKAQFEDTNRWTNTATNGDGLQQGDPITLTWSIVPDGTQIYGYSGEPAAPSNLRSFLDDVYGSERVWLPLIEQVFSRWGEVTGIQYVYEPNDDGDPWLSNYIAPGDLGIRGDIRIAGHRIDGDFGILAYNFLPNFGDMILDADDNFFSNTANNSLGLRNVIAHEHGHGLGISHVCPVNQTKLMEPFLSTAFDGPQHDDILAAQRGYGDFYEHNEEPIMATDLGQADIGAGIDVFDLSLDSNADVDVYSINVDADSNLEVTVTPVGISYYSGPQLVDGSCSAGALMNSLNVKDLWFEVLDQDRSTVIASIDDNDAGMQETLNDLALSNGAGTYYIRIRGDVIDQIQLYELSITLREPIGDVEVNNPGADASESAENTIFRSGFD